MERKKMKDKPLSEKSYEYPIVAMGEVVYLNKDVKEAVSKLKEEIGNKGKKPTRKYLQGVVNKIFGEFK